MKRFLSALLAVFMIATLICVPAFAEGENDSPYTADAAIVADTSWYTPAGDANTYYIYDAADLLGLSELTQGGNNFSGKTIKLAADIDLNPKWSAEVTFDGDNKAILPSAKNVFAGLKDFSGTLDGQNYTISGLYMSDANSSLLFGFIPTTNGCTVKNISFTNGLVYSVVNSGSSNDGTGGLIGNVSNASAVIVIENVYFDVNVVNKRGANATAGKSMLGGVIGRFNKVSSATLNNVVYAGDVIALAADDTATASVLNVSQICAGSHANMTGTNCVAIGAIKSGKPAHVIGEQYESFGEGKMKYVNYVEGVKAEGTEVSESMFKIATAGTPTYTPACTYDSNTAAFTYSAKAGSMVPTAVATMLARTVVESADAKDTVYVADTSFVDPTTTYEISTPEQFMGVSKLSNEGTTFAGVTLKLTADINLNPNWVAAGYAGVDYDQETQKVALRTAPTNKFTAGGPLSKFEGVFDGQGYALSGFYVNKTGASWHVGGMISYLNTGVVKNIVFNNSVIYTGFIDTIEKDNVGQSAFVGCIENGGVVENVYVDVDYVQVYTTKYGVTGGVVGYCYTGSLESSAFAGNIYTVDSENKLNSGWTYASQLVGADRSVVFSVKNCVGLGALYAADNKAETMLPQAANNPTVIENYLIGKLTAVDASKFGIDSRTSETTYNAETVDMVYSKVAGAVVPATVAAMLNHNAWAQTGTITVGEEQVKALRILTGLESLDWAEVSYTVKVGEKTESTGAITTVYESVTAAGEDVAASTLNANYEYLYGLVIKNIPDNCTLTVTPVVTTAKGTVVTFHSFTVEVVNGEVAE